MIDPIQAEIDALMHGPGDDSAMQGQQIKFIRGPDGQFAGAQIGDKTVMFTRDAQGDIDGLRAANQSPQQMDMPQANQQQQPMLPSPFGPR